jgi:hypothetical protein
MYDEYRQHLYTYLGGSANLHNELVANLIAPLAHKLQSLLVTATSGPGQTTARGLPIQLIHVFANFIHSLDYLRGRYCAFNTS